MKHIFRTSTGSIALALLFIISACSKGGDSSTPTPTATKTQLLISSDWAFAGLQSKKETATAWTDDYAAMLPCEKDNKFVFKSNNTYEYNEGAAKCNTNDPQIIQTGTWQLTSNETMLALKQVTGGTDAITANIEVLTSTSLIFYYSKKIAGPFSDTYQYRYVFKR